MEEESFSTLSDCIQSSCSSQRTVPLFGFLCGSRAWGVSDVSSDYDVRVLFWPVDEDDERIPDSFCVQEDRGGMKIEVQGWDVRKCVRLLCSFNATLAEWLASKCIFAADKVLLRAWQAAVAQTPPSTFVPFYLGLLKSERRKHLGGRKEVVLAEYLHAARPALMLNALSAKKDCAFPDTRFDVLLSIGGVPEDARSFLADLASRKRSGALRRGEEGAHSRFVDKWFDELEERHSKTKAAPLSESLLSLFRNLISRSRIAAQAPVKEVRVAVVHLSDYKDSFGRSYGELMFELLSAANASAQSEKEGPFEFDASNEAIELPRHGEYDLLLLPGSPLSCFDDVPCVRRMESWLRSTLERSDHSPIFGICFGHQMMGRCLGARVARNPLGVEKGARLMTLCGDWASSTGSVRVLQSHQDAILELPPGATLLASNDKGIQAFRVGSKIVCLQGHPECGVEQGLYFLHPEIPLDPNIVKEAEKTISEFGAGDTSLIGTLVWKLLLPELVGTMT